MICLILGLMFLTGCETEAKAESLLTLINAERRQRGMAEVGYSENLTCAAKRHAEDLRRSHKCGHYGSDGSGPYDRARDCGSVASGEIVACGQTTRRAALRAWVMSPSHAEIMLDREQTDAGYAEVGEFWVVVFKKRK